MPRYKLFTMRPTKSVLKKQTDRKRRETDKDVDAYWDRSEMHFKEVVDLSHKNRCSEAFVKYSWASEDLGATRLRLMDLHKSKHPNLPSDSSLYADQERAKEFFYKNCLVGGGLSGVRRRRR